MWIVQGRGIEVLPPQCLIYLLAWWLRETLCEFGILRDVLVRVDTKARGEYQGPVFERRLIALLPYLQMLLYAFLRLL